MAREIDDPLTVSPTTLRRRLKDKGYLASCDIKRQVLTVRKTVAGCKKNLLHLRLEVILDGVGSSSADVGSMSSGAAEPDTSFPYGSNELRGNVGNVGFSSGGDGDGENQRGPSHDLVGEEVFEI